VDFLIETVSPEEWDKPGLKRIIRKDEYFRNKFLCKKRLLRKLMDDEEILLKITPRLFLRSSSERPSMICKR
jgi:hypothetical protein